MEPTEHQQTLGAIIDGIQGYANDAIGFARQVYEWSEAHKKLVEAGLHGAKVRGHQSTRGSRPSAWSVPLSEMREFSTKNPR